MHHLLKKNRKRKNRFQCRKKKSKTFFFLHFTKITKDLQKIFSYIVVAAVSFYFVTSLSTVLFNKIIMSNYEFPYPLFISWFQFVVALFCIGIMSFVGSLYPSINVMAGVSSNDFNYHSFRKILPLTALYISMICFSNLTLQWSQVSFYQIARSLTIVFSMIFSYVFLGKTVRPQKIQKKKSNSKIRKQNEFILLIIILK